MSMLPAAILAEGDVTDASFPNGVTAQGRALTYPQLLQIADLSGDDFNSSIAVKVHQ